MSLVSMLFSMLMVSQHARDSNVTPEKRQKGKLMYQTICLIFCWKCERSQMPIFSGFVNSNFGVNMTHDLCFSLFETIVLSASHKMIPSTDSSV